MYQYEPNGQLTMLDMESCEEIKKAPRPRAAKPDSELIAVPYFHLDLSPVHVDLFGCHYWELRSPLREGKPPLNTGVAPRAPIRASLSDILEPNPDLKYFLTATACLGILRRADNRGKELPEQLEAALMIQAGLTDKPYKSAGLKAYHINQRDEGIDLNGVSGALMATNNMQMQTFVTQSEPPIGFDGYNGDLTGGLSATLGVNCGMSTGRNGVIAPIAFAANQRDEVRDLRDIAGALGAQPGMKQQTFVVQAMDAEAFAGNPLAGYRESKVASTEIAGQGRCYNTLVAPAVFGQTQYGNYDDRVATLRAQCGDNGGGSENLVVCLNDQGGSRMDVSYGKAGTLRASMSSHEPLVLASQQGGAEIGKGICPTITAAAGMSGNNQPVLFENHGIDSRYTGPCAISPTISARAGTGGNNLPLALQPAETLCIAGNIIDRLPHNGGNGFGYQADLAYTLTATDHHAVWSETYQEVVGTLCSGDEKGAGDQYVSQDKCIVSDTLLIRRLTPLECERLQGFPDLWTDLPCASDTSRYKALGNSVAIPCVEHIMLGLFLAAGDPRVITQILPVCEPQYEDDAVYL